METVLAYLRDSHPNAVVDAMSGGSERVRAKQGIAASSLAWFEMREQRTSGLARVFLKIFGKLIDPLRIMSWVRRHDAVIVPGAGILEATLPMRAYGFPFSMFLLCVSGKILGVRVALVSVGADFIKKRVTRQLSNAVARLAFYRSYRDGYSMDAIQQRGIDTSRDHVFPDLVFGVPTPPPNEGDLRLVGVGVMDYHGGNDDRERANEIHAAYVEKMISFARRLLENGYSVRLFGGDSKADQGVVDQIMADISGDRQGRGAQSVTVASMSSYADMMDEMNQVGTVVATRYHNVMCALKLCKPTLAIGYSQKFVALMDGMGLAEFTQFAYELDVDRLVGDFDEIQSRREQLVGELTRRNAANAEGLARQFALISASLLPASASLS
jgi:polysaccharide pyruvyl transferase WcaK-like protein